MFNMYNKNMNDRMKEMIAKGEFKSETIDIITKIKDV